MADERDGLKIARQRIAQEAAERTGFLDLGRLGLTCLPEELFDLSHLRRLNLGSGMTDEETSGSKPPRTSRQTMSNPKSGSWRGCPDSPLSRLREVRLSRSERHRPDCKACNRLIAPAPRSAI